MEESKSRKNAKVAKICGILSVVIGIVGSCCCMGYFATPFSTIAIILGALSRDEITQELYPEAKSAVICGIVGTGIGIFGSIIVYVMYIILGLGFSVNSWV